MKILYSLSVILFLSCTKTDLSYWHTTNEDPLPSRIVSNFLNLQHGDTLYPAGLNTYAFKFVYLENDIRVLQDKWYEQSWYTEKLELIAQDAFRRITSDIPLSNEILNSYSFSFIPYYKNCAVPGNFSWKMVDLKY